MQALALYLSPVGRGRREVDRTERRASYSGKNSPREWLSTESVPVAISK
jgi:hypothetical protein